MMMKNLLLIALVFGITACSTKPSYEVKLKLTSAEGKAYLSQRKSGDWVKLDSVNLVNGEAVFKGVVKNPEIYYLVLSSKKDRFPFFIENSMISVSGSADSIMNLKVVGSKVQDELQALQDKIDVIDKQGNNLYELSKEAAKNGNKSKADSLMTLSDEAFMKEENLQKDYIKANPTSYISPYILGQVYYEMEADVLNGFLSGLDSKLDSVPTVLSLKDRVAKLKLVAIGQTALDFTLNDASGNPIKLSDVYSKNEYTLIDFWASWCGPCRRENPNVVSVFNSYKAKGFGVFGVSLDSDKAKWEKAVADDKLAWPQVSDLKGWKNEAAAIYSVNSIPSNLLIDKTGKIVGRNLREEKLRLTISGLLK